MLNQKSVYSRRGLIPALAAIAVVAIVGLLASFLVIGNAAQTVTTTQVTTVPTTITTDPAVNSSSQLNSEQDYANANRSIVTIRVTQVQNSFYGNQVASILGSGFVVSYSGANYIVTNYHVAGTTSNLTVTFSNGDSYPAKVVGSDPYSDLAIVSVQAPSSEFYPLTLAASSSLRVGDSVVAIGDPYGLTGSMTEGIVSQSGRTIQDENGRELLHRQRNPNQRPDKSRKLRWTSIGCERRCRGNNHGGHNEFAGSRLCDSVRHDNRGLPSLIANGSYNLHSYLGISETDMNYQLSQATGANVTYSVLIERSPGRTGGNSRTAIGYPNSRDRRSAVSHRGRHHHFHKRYADHRFGLAGHLPCGTHGGGSDCITRNRKSGQIHDGNRNSGARPSL